MDRIACQKVQRICIDSQTVHRLFYIALLVACKYHDDTSYKNSFYSIIAGVTLKELNIMEIDFLYAIGFELYVTPEIFQKYKNLLCNKI
jgi:hypothetical protein